MTEFLEEQYRNILKGIGEDPNRQGLLGTPGRASRAMKFLTKGYGESLDTIINNAIFDSDMDEMVIVKDIEFFSLCEHHLLPFFGRCHAAYLPNGKIIGLSKVARIVDMYARRLQVQENLTSDIAKTLQQLTNAKGVGVVMEASHLCMKMRGVEKQNSTMTTSCMLGWFRTNASTRSEFLNLIK